MNLRKFERVLKDLENGKWVSPNNIIIKWIRAEWTPENEIYYSYVNWSLDQNLIPRSKEELREEVRNNGNKVVCIDNSWYYFGVKLKEGHP